MFFELFLATILVFAIVFVVFVFAYGKKEQPLEVFEEIRNPVVMQILVPRENDKTPLAAEQMFSSLHGILRGSKKSLDMVSFEITSNGDEGIKFYAVAPEHLAKFVEGQIYAQYPAAEISFVQDYTQRPVKTSYTNGDPYQAFVTTGEIELDKSFIFPIKTFRSFEVDPLAAITSAIANLKEGDYLWTQIIVRPVANYWQDTSKNYITAIKEGKALEESSVLKVVFGLVSTFLNNIQASSESAKAPQKEVVKLAPGQEEELSQIGEKMLKLGFEVKIRLIAKSGDQLKSELLLRDIVASFKQFTTAHLNSFKHSEPSKSGEEIYNDYARRYMPSVSPDILNIEELASVYHLPNVSVETPSISWSRASKAEPPLNLPVAGTDDVNVFAETDYRGQRFEFGIKRPDRRRHFYLLGKTGVGKSTLFKNMFISDVLAGDGACFVDPHGETVEELLDYIPPNRINDVVYFNPADTDHPVGFNMMELDDPNQRDLVADGVVSVFKKQFESWGPRLQYILQNAVATCLEAQGTTILAVQRILVDKNYRKFVLKQVKDPILIKFWNEEYQQMSQNSKLISEAVAPIQNKVGRFIASAIIRNIVGQVKSTVSLKDIMNQGKILLINLSQGQIGEESCSLLGGMLISRLQSTAMERVSMAPEDRKDFFLYVDEFQNFATDSFAKVLSEARKFKLNLTMTNQYIDQLPLTVRQAIFGNVGSLASFVVSQDDATVLANEFAPVFKAEDLVSLEAHSMYVKICIDGMTSKPFSARSLNLRYPKYSLRNEILQNSRSSYSTNRDIIEDKIKRWTEQEYSDKGNRSVEKNNGPRMENTVVKTPRIETGKKEKAEVEAKA